MADRTGHGATPSAPKPLIQYKRVRVSKLTPEQRKAIARKAAQTRWNKLPPPTPAVAPSVDKETSRKKVWRTETTPPPEPMVTITLQLRHSCNGKFVGPGTVTLPRYKAEQLMNTEYEAAQKELSLVQQQAFIIGVGPGGPVRRQVPWARFDEIIAREYS